MCQSLFISHIPIVPLPVHTLPSWTHLLVSLTVSLVLLFAGLTDTPMGGLDDKVLRLPQHTGFTKAFSQGRPIILCQQTLPWTFHSSQVWPKSHMILVAILSAEPFLAFSPEGSH